MLSWRYDLNGFPVSFLTHFKHRLYLVTKFSCRKHYFSFFLFFFVFLFSFFETWLIIHFDRIHKTTKEHVYINPCVIFIKIHENTSLYNCTYPEIYILHLLGNKCISSFVIYIYIYVGIHTHTRTKSCWKI